MSTTTIETETEATERTRTLITGGDPDERYPLPSKGDLRAGDGVIRAHDLGTIARSLIDSDELPFEELGGLKIAYLWVEKGGQTGGFPTFGKMGKESKINRHFSQFDYVASLSVDHLETIKATRWVVEALVAHQLGHIATATTEKGEDRYGIKGHDFEGFGFEFERYGVYLSGQVSAAGLVAAAVQLGMVWEDDEEDDDGEYDPAVAQAPGVDEEAGPVPDGAPAADWADAPRPFYDEDEPRPISDSELDAIIAGNGARADLVRQNFPRQFKGGADVCRACGLPIGEHAVDYCAGGSQDAAKKSRKNRSGAGDADPEPADAKNETPVLGQLGASENGSHDPDVASVVRNGSDADDVLYDPDTVMRTVGEIHGMKIVYQTSIDGGPGRYVHPTSGEVYDTSHIESLYRKAIAGR